MPRSTDIDVVLFDLDGTLVDSRPGIVRCANLALAEHGLEPLRDDQVPGFIGPPLRDSFRSLSPPEEILESLVATYRRHYGEGGLTEFRVYDGIGATLAALVDDGHVLGVATSKAADFARIVLEHGGIDAPFRYVAGAHADGTGADKADVMRRAMAALEVTSPSRVVMVGDRIFDLDGARSTETHFVVAGWGFSVPGEFDHEPDLAILDHPSDLVTWTPTSPLGRAL